MSHTVLLALNLSGSEELGSDVVERSGCLRPDLSILGFAKAKPSLSIRGDQQRPGPSLLSNISWDFYVRLIFIQINIRPI